MLAIVDLRNSGKVFAGQSIFSFPVDSNVLKSSIREVITFGSNIAFSPRALKTQILVKEVSRRRSLHTQGFGSVPKSLLSSEP